jgi:GNAT superfamily N-acetyltransferase
MAAAHPYHLRLARPEETEESWEVERQVWSPFNWLAEGSVGLDYIPELHVVATDEDGRLVATIDACGIEWDGEVASLPAGGWHDVNVRAAEGFASRPPYACALGASVLPEAQGASLSSDLLTMLRDQALSLGYLGMLAPVRPSARARMPHLGIDDYALVRLADGRHFDPWVRTHEGVGGRIIATTKRSMSWRGPREEWEGWLEMRLPQDGRLLVPGSTGWLTMEGGQGELVEDSIWVLHSPSAGE